MAGLPPSTPFKEWLRDLRADAEHSWARIFDLDAYPDDEYWQATVEEVHVADVISAVRPIRWPWSRRG